MEIRPATYVLIFCKKKKKKKRSSNIKTFRHESPDIFVTNNYFIEINEYFAILCCPYSNDMHSQNVNVLMKNVEPDKNTFKTEMEAWY